LWNGWQEGNNNLIFIKNMTNTLIYIFPSETEKLDGAATISVLQNAKWDLDSEYSILLPEKEANGHLVWQNTVQKAASTNCNFDFYKDILAHNQDVELHTDLFSISYAIHDLNPNIAFRWPRKWFYFLEEKQKNEYLELILKCAEAARASYVLFVEDLFDLFEDRFEDRFVAERGYRFFDDSPKKASAWDFAIDEVWIKKGNHIKLKSNKTLIFQKELNVDFEAYKL
jgi:hypothetical protein